MLMKTLTAEIFPLAMRVLRFFMRVRFPPPPPYHKKLGVVKNSGFSFVHAGLRVFGVFEKCKILWFFCSIIDKNIPRFANENANEIAHNTAPAVLLAGAVC